MSTLRSGEEGKEAAASSTSSSVITAEVVEENVEKKGFFGRFFDTENIRVNSSFNRWLVIPPALLTHISIGSVYAWSLMNGPLTHEMGVLASAPSDWSLPEVIPVFSTILALHGISAALFGKWQERVGPRVAGVAGAFCFGGGLILGGIGVMTHTLPLLYVGYGVLSGLGLGLSYVPPVATVIRWFPDRKGLASGLTMMGFGGGALAVAPFMSKLLNYFAVAPEYVGSTETVKLITEEGRRFVERAGELKEVIVATASDIASSPFPDLAEGVYLAGTGTTVCVLVSCVMCRVYVYVYVYVCDSSPSQVFASVCSWE